MVQDAMDFFGSQFEEQRAVAQPVIDQQLETMLSQSEFAKAQQQRYLDEGVPAQEAAAAALRDLANTPEGETFLQELNKAYADVGGTDGEQRFRQALENYGVSQAETDYLTQLGAYQDPGRLKRELTRQTTYRDPTEVRAAIDNLSNYDSTARVREAEGVAAADVAASGEAARQAAIQRLEQYGIDPSQMQSGALDRQLRAENAANAALASSQARRDIQAQGLQADVQAGQLAAESGLREMQVRLNAAEGLMQSRIRELQMAGLGAEEARMQADREIGYSQQLAQMEAAQRNERVGYSEAAARTAEAQQARQIAGQVDAYNLFAGNPTGAAQSFGVAGAAGGQAFGTAAQNTQTGLGAYQGFSQMSQGAANTAVSGYQVANSIYGNQIASEQARAESAAGPMNMLGNIIGTVGGAAMMASDERVKTDVKRVGETDEGLPVYTYRYKAGGPTQMGVMAQEAAEVHPEAVAQTPGGMLAVDYRKLNEGGAVPDQWSPSGGAVADDVTAQISAGEYVFPEDVTRWFGEEKLGKMVEKARADRGARTDHRGVTRGGMPPPQAQGQAPATGAIPMR